MYGGACNKGKGENISRCMRAAQIRLDVLRLSRSIMSRYVMIISSLKPGQRLISSTYHFAKIIQSRVG